VLVSLAVGLKADKNNWKEIGLCARQVMLILLGHNYAQIIYVAQLILSTFWKKGREE
jgi:hypothetical protein